MKQQIRRILALALVVLALAAIFTGCAKKPGKTLTVDVTHGDGTTKTFTVKTDAENLGAALVEDKEIGVTGEDSDYGIFITTVDGEAASNEEQTFWSISKDGVDLGRRGQPAHCRRRALRADAQNLVNQIPRLSIRPAGTFLENLRDCL